MRVEAKSVQVYILEIHKLFGLNIFNSYEVLTKLLTKEYIKKTPSFKFLDSRRYIDFCTELLREKTTENIIKKLNTKTLDPRDHLSAIFSAFFSYFTFYVVALSPTHKTVFFLLNPVSIFAKDIKVTFTKESIKSSSNMTKEEKKETTDETKEEEKEEEKRESKDTSTQTLPQLIACLNLNKYIPKDKIKACHTLRKTNISNHEINVALALISCCYLEEQELKNTACNLLVEISESMPDIKRIWVISKLINIITEIGSNSNCDHLNKALQQIIFYHQLNLLILEKLNPPALSKLVIKYM